LVGFIKFDENLQHEYLLSNETNSYKCVIYLTKNFPFKITFHDFYVRLSFYKIIYSKNEFLSIGYLMGGESEEEQEKIWNHYEKFFSSID
jgi:hypothetical protein